ncbi:hypothetical protein BB558_000019 [Smittium angustum]|uniref:Methylmalonic aciduria and homocystinuria type D protein n=1 Tax=Smittium angustum TaxID=133377 RepID=A0A2U1JG08_SMIAN|nr:hypothetical protein BB558_000019 [Smittium angustum]
MVQTYPLQHSIKTPTPPTSFSIFNLTQAHSDFLNHFGSLADSNLPENVSLQYSIHSCPRVFTNELKLVFPELKHKPLSQLYIVPTFQKTNCELVNRSDHSKAEKDQKLLNFYLWGLEFVQKLRNLGYWADLACPASGQAVFTQSGPTIYPEVECCRKLLKYQTYNVGGCNVISHPLWDMCSYPATAFALAPLEKIQFVIDEMNRTQDNINRH